MKNIPNKIYLVIGEDVSTKDDIDFDSLKQVSWSGCRVNKTDIVYFRKKERKNKK